MTRRYRGWRDRGGVAHISVRDDRRSGKALNPRYDLANHSPDGFEWGYGGSGPAQAALAILADCLQDDERAMRLYQKFKWKVVAGLVQEEPWTLTDKEVIATVNLIEKGEQR